MFTFRAGEHIRAGVGIGTSRRRLPFPHTLRSHPPADTSAQACIVYAPCVAQTNIQWQPAVPCHLHANKHRIRTLLFDEPLILAFWEATQQGFGGFTPKRANQQSGQPDRFEV